MIDTERMLLEQIAMALYREAEMATPWWRLSHKTRLHWRRIASELLREPAP